MTSVLIRRRQSEGLRDSDTQGTRLREDRGRDGILQPQVKEDSQPQKAGRGTEDAPLDTPEGAWPCQQLDFRLLATRTGRD